MDKLQTSYNIGIKLLNKTKTTQYEKVCPKIRGFGCRKNARVWFQRSSYGSLLFAILRNIGFLYFYYTGKIWECKYFFVEWLRKYLKTIARYSKDLQQICCRSFASVTLPTQRRRRRPIWGAQSSGKGRGLIVCSNINIWQNGI